MKSDLPLVTTAQLALRNGQDKSQVVWIAYNGVVYDLTYSGLWREGKHYEHWAGQDLHMNCRTRPTPTRSLRGSPPLAD